MSEELDGLFETLENDLLSKYQYNLLLNYITNLQKENEKLKDELYSTNQVVNELLDIQSRNEKAVEFVKSMEYCGQEDYFYDLKSKDQCGNDNTFNDSKYKLLNILQGGDE